MRTYILYTKTHTTTTQLEMLKAQLGSSQQDREELQRQLLEQFVTIQELHAKLKMMSALGLKYLHQVIRDTFSC